MILLKGFLRKKTTKNYFIVFFIVSLILISLLISQKYFIKLNNENYKGSYIFITDTLNKYNQIKKNSNFKTIEIGSPIINEWEIDTYILVGSDLVIDNDTIFVPLKYQNLLSSIIKVNDTELVIKDVYEGYNNNIFLINKNTAQELSKKVNKVTYVIDLKNWTYYDRIINNLKNTYENVFAFVDTSQEINYNTIITAFDIFIILTLVVLAVITVVSCLNIIEDEKKNNTLYHYIGYSKLRIIMLLSSKIIFIIGINAIIMILIYKLMSNLI